MTTAEGIFSARATGREDVPDGPKTDTATRTVLLAGAEAGNIRQPLEALIQGKQAALEILHVDTLLEAVLIAGGRAENTPEEPMAGELLILAGVSQEIDQLESAVRSLRKVYGHAEIVLLCDPCDEVLCRRARGWGASDYLILPVDGRSLRELLLVPRDVVTPRTPERQTLKPAPALASDLATVEKKPIRSLPLQSAVADLDLPMLPLMVQTTLMTDLMSGQPEFMKRAIATLQSYVRWNGTLRFVPALSPADEGAPIAPAQSGEFEVPVTAGSGNAAAQSPFGMLVLSPGPTMPAAAAMPPPALAQAAQWLGTMLSMARRYEQLRALAVTDELSGAYNRRYFQKFMSGLLERSRVNRSRVTLLLFDIDDFKQYNDRFGHASGDAIIRELIKVLRSCTREHDVVARLGGDEFAVVYWDKGAPRQPNSEHPRDVLMATERFRNAIKTHEWPRTCNIQGEISISGGMATFPWDADSLEQLMAKADEALLRAKSAGKNVILLHASERGQDQGTPIGAGE